MLQRIQSVYLVAMALLAVLLFFVPFYNTEHATTSGLELFSLNLYDVQVSKRLPEIQSQTIPQLPLRFLALFLISGSIGTLFMFRNRPTQALFARTLALVAGALLALALGIVWKYSAAYSIPLNVRGMREGLLIAFVIAVLGVLALRGIRKDIALVRSADRIR